MAIPSRKERPVLTLKKRRPRLTGPVARPSEAIGAPARVERVGAPAGRASASERLRGASRATSGAPSGGSSAPGAGGPASFGFDHRALTSPSDAGLGGTYNNARRRPTVTPMPWTNITSNRLWVA